MFLKEVLDSHRHIGRFCSVALMSCRESCPSDDGCLALAHSMQLFTTLNTMMTVPCSQAMSQQ